jgi:hypothetical protein
MTAQPNVTLRLQLAALRARYDHGAVSPGVWAVIREIETAIAWSEHQTGEQQQS